MGLKQEAPIAGCFLHTKPSENLTKSTLKTQLLREFSSLRSCVPPILLGAAPTGNKIAERIYPGFRWNWFEVVNGLRFTQRQKDFITTCKASQASFGGLGKSRDLCPQTSHFKFDKTATRIRQLKNLVLFASHGFAQTRPRKKSAPIASWD